VRAVVVDDHAAVRQPPVRRLRAAEERGLGVDLRRQRAGRERGHLHDAGERRPSARRIEQVVRWCAVAPAPAAPADAARGDACAGELERVQRASVKWAFDLDRARDLLGPADEQVAGAVDGEARMRCECFAEQVGEQPLGQSAAVQHQARRARDRACLEVDFELPPAPRRRRGGGLAGGRKRERGGERERLAQIAGVAGALELSYERAVDEAAAQRPRLAHGLREARHQRAHRHRLARVAVQARELAAGLEAREALMPCKQRAPDQRRGLVRRASLPGADHQRRAARAEAVELLDRLALGAHDCDVVTAAAPELDSPDSPVLVDSLAPVDSLALVDSPADVDVPVAEEVELAAAVDSALAPAARFRALATSAGSWPEASCA